MEDRVQINAFVLTTAFKGVDRRKNDALDIKIRLIKLKVKGIKVVKFQKPLCQFGKTHSFAQNDLEIFLVLIRRNRSVDHGFDISLDGGQRGTEVVGDIRDK